MSRRKKDKIEHVLLLKDLETLSNEEIFEKYGLPSRRIKSRISNLRMIIETYDFPSPADWFEANGNHIHEMAVYGEDHGYIETCKHFRISYTVQKFIHEYKNAHPELFKTREHIALPDIDTGVCKLYDQYKDVEKVMGVFIEELHLENLDYRRQMTIRNRARSALEKYKGGVVYSKSKIFKDVVYGELSRDFIMEIIDYNRVNGYEACKEKYFLDRDFTTININMYSTCKRFNININLWTVPIRDAESKLQREKAIETIDYYYEHGADATVKKYAPKYKSCQMAMLVDRWKRRYGLFEKYRGMRPPKVKKGA